MNWAWLDHLGMEIFVGTLTFLGYAFTLLLIPEVLLTKKRWPSSTVAWLMAIALVPVLGGVLYLAFGVDRVGRQVQRRRRATAAYSRSMPRLTLVHWHPEKAVNETQRQLMRLAETVGRTHATAGNRIELYHRTPDAFEAIQSAIARAEHSIHLEYYIWQPDRIGTALRDQLIEKARQGVKVCFLYDSLGSLRLGNAFFQPMRDAGIQVAAFVPGRTLRDTWSINFRSHRKIIVVDGQIGFTGGMNVGDEYLGRSRHFGYWRDVHLRMEGPAVLQLQQIFATDWHAATHQELHDDVYFPTPTDSGRVAAQVVAGGPDCEPSVFHTLMFAAINEAQQRVTLATSYFVPTPALCSALVAAALRGVRVQVFVSGPVTYWATYHAARSFYDELLDGGVEVYEYRRGQQHAKTLTIDGCWALVGTPNFDPRSVFLNFEVGVVMYDYGIAEQLDHHVEQDLADAVRIDPAKWSQRSVWERLKENTCRMFVPVL